ncbi:MAG: phosphatidyl-myo-inositol dimannoside synthase, partial [Actinomycetota bacterium]|nr:phosphatidyl-myo-inositol dimannoside synthase [Actinomycetota bacterium]
MSTSRRYRVTYVTRKFPPSVGGMETLAQNTDLALHLSLGDSGLFALRRSNRNLVWWAPVTAVRLVADIAARRSASYLFGDALVWALLGWIPLLFRVPAFTMVCGLDITFSNRLYRAVVHPRLRRAPRVLAISEATLGEAIDAGVARDRAHVITMGLVPPPASELPHDSARARLLAENSLPTDAILLLTTGRLVRRKGVRWFTSEVMPLLNS